AKTQRHDRESRVGVAHRWKYGAAANEQVLDAMHAAICIHDAMFRIARHASRTHVMILSFYTPRPSNCPGTGVEPAPGRYHVVGEQLHPTEAHSSNFGREDFDAAVEGTLLEIAEPPIECNSGHPERIVLVGEHDSAVRVRLLFHAHWQKISRQSFVTPEERLVGVQRLLLQISCHLPHVDPEVIVKLGP